MGKQGRRKQAVVRLVAPPMSSRREARRVTSSFHALAARVASADPSEAASLRRKLEHARARYQEASVLSTSLYSTSLWVVRTIERLGAGRSVLEIGAVNTQLLDSSRVDCRSVDVRSTNPRIERADFFDVDGRWDAIVCSLVLNCVETPEKRRRMLAKMRDSAHQLVFVVLPRSCLERSTRTSPDAFFDALRRLGFVELERRLSPKLLHLCLTPADRPFAPDARLLRPVTASKGAAVPPLDRRKPTNDFAI